MQISNTMRLGELAMHMGQDATDDEAEAMRHLLVGFARKRPKIVDTADVPDADWQRLCELAVTDYPSDDEWRNLVALLRGDAL